MHEKGRGAGAGQSCGDFAADVAGFAHAQHHDPALTMQHQFTGADEIVINPGDQLGYRLGFDSEDLAGQLFQQVFAHVRQYRQSVVR